MHSKLPAFLIAVEEDDDDDGNVNVDMTAVH